MAEILIESDPKQFPPHFYLQRFSQYLEKHDNMNREFWNFVVNANMHHYPFVVDFQDLIEFDGALAYTLLQFPKLLLPLFDDALGSIQHHWRGNEESIARYGHVRIAGLPAISSATKSSIAAIRTSEDSKLIQVYGTVTSTGAIRMLDISKEYECQNSKCKHRFRVYADPENDNVIVHPRSCTRVLSQSPSMSRCNSTSLREIESSRICVDFQEIKIQDKLDQLPFGSVPKSITVTLQADLADKCLPGDDVVIVGSILRKWHYLSKGSRSSMDIVFHANSISLLDEAEHGEVLLRSQVSKFDLFWTQYQSTGQELQGRDLIIQSVCSQLYGLSFAKLSLLLSLIGGAKAEEQAASQSTEKRRTNIHLLMVGDPGCGKSQLLSFATAMFPRAVLTTGTGTTGAGLTCAAMKDGHGEWTLEAGALVLANGGICCIDEFSSIKEQDRATIHEAMEQQTVSVAKAGLVVKLNTITTVIASCNFKGQFDASVDLAANTAIGSPLLSRFDIVLLMHDIPNKEWDISVSTHLLKASIEQRSKSRTSKGDHHKVQLPNDTWDVDTLRHYIQYVRHAFQPVVTDEAKVLLVSCKHC